MQNRSYIKVYIILCLLMIGHNTSLFGQLKFNSEKVKEIYSLVPDQIKLEIKRNSEYKLGTYYNSVNIFGEIKTIICRFNQYQELEHLGLFVVDDQNLNPQMRDLFDFVERILLRSLLLKEKSLLERETFESGITVYFNGGLLNASTSRAISILPNISINSKMPLSIRVNSNSFSFQWKLDDTNTFLIKVPNNYSIISGKTKDELEQHLLREIKDYHFSKVNTSHPAKEQLKLVSQDMYLLPGNFYSTTPELSSSKYYYLNDSIFPVFNSRNYKESIRNQFLNLVSTTSMLEITQKLYGGVDEEFKININRFLSFFNDDYDIFFGWQSSEKENLKATVYLSNKVYNFNHLLVVSPKIKTFFRKNEITEGLFFAFIPRENIENNKE